MQETAILCQHCEIMCQIIFQSKNSMECLTNVYFPHPKTVMEQKWHFSHIRCPPTILTSQYRWFPLKKMFSVNNFFLENTPCFGGTLSLYCLRSMGVKTVTLGPSQKKLYNRQYFHESHRIQENSLHVLQNCLCPTECGASSIYICPEQIKLNVVDCCGWLHQVRARQFFKMLRNKLNAVVVSPDESQIGSLTKTCLADFVHPWELTISAGTYFPYLTQSMWVWPQTLFQHICILPHCVPCNTLHSIACDTCTTFFAENLSCRNTVCPHAYKSSLYLSFSKLRRSHLVLFLKTPDRGSCFLW